MIRLIVIGVAWSTHGDRGGEGFAGPYPVYQLRGGDQRRPQLPGRRPRRWRLCSSAIPLQPFG